MTADLAALRVMLEEDEGKRRYPYDDATGKPPAAVGKVTIGIGRNLTDVPLTDDEIDLLFENDATRAIGALSSRLPWALMLPAPDRRVMIDLCFNLGIDGLQRFPRFLDAMRTRNAAVARAELWNSKWARQVGDGPGNRRDRADRLTAMIGTLDV